MLRFITRVSPWLAPCVATLLAACGGDEPMTGTAANLDLPAGVTFPDACNAERREIALHSHDALVDGSPRRMFVIVTCGRGVLRLGGVAVDWQVVEGGGNVGGQASMRSTTNADGVAEGLWTFGSDGPAQTLEARLPSTRATVTHTLLPRRADPCHEPAGTDLGAERVVTGTETWTRSGSPYATRCASGATCSERITIAPGARLEIEAGVAVCARRLLVDGTARLIAAGSIADPVHLQVRNGIVLLPAPHAVPASTSVLRHVYFENVMNGLLASGHPIVIEDSVLRRAALGDDDSVCPSVALRQHALAGVIPSRLQRTVIDGFGMLPNPWDYGLVPVCAGLQIEIGDDTPPLQASARVINSLGEGVHMLVSPGARGVAQTQLSQCEISGSAGIGLFASVHQQADASPRVTACNIRGNALAGVEGTRSGAAGVDARGNWWGDPEGPSGPRGDGVGAGVNATEPLAAPLELGY